MDSQVLEVSRSRYFGGSQALARGPSGRPRRTLVEEIREIHAEHRGNEDVLCINAELRGFRHAVNAGGPPGCPALLLPLQVVTPTDSPLDCRRPRPGPPYLSNSDDLIMVRCYVDMNSQTWNGSYWLPTRPGP
ncbi:hypothetical protein ACFWWB_29365 [Streptomyces sp. NPDC058690]|uniref:hypothetical protein n=1 Tax=Streptomyces sp. NPDC058690 TaxID=3346600 RepID=UPI0036573DAF